MILPNTTIDVLVGQTLSKIEVAKHNEEIFFFIDNQQVFHSYHMQDCCEHVRLVNIIGNIDNILKSPIIWAHQETFEGPEPEYPDSWTWTAQTITTKNGSVRFEWLGESNGYYSEKVYFGRL